MWSSSLEKRGRSMYMYICNAPGCSMIRIKVDSNIRLRDYIWPAWIKIKCSLQTVTANSQNHMLLFLQQLWKFSKRTNTLWRQSFTSYTCAKYTFEYVIRQEIIMPTAYIPGILLSLKGRQVHLFKNIWHKFEISNKIKLSQISNLNAQFRGLSKLCISQICDTLPQNLILRIYTRGHRFNSGLRIWFQWNSCCMYSSHKTSNFF